LDRRIDAFLTGLIVGVAGTSGLGVVSPPLQLGFLLGFSKLFLAALVKIVVWLSGHEASGLGGVREPARVTEPPDARLVHPEGVVEGNHRRAGPRALLR
jgi:hypothetical protein